MPTRDIDTQGSKAGQSSWALETAQYIFKRRQLPLVEMAERDDVLNIAYQYWQSKRNGNLLPSRSNIDILEITRLIKHTHLIDVRDSDPENWFFRLVGSIVPQTLGWPIGRDTLSACPWPEYKAMLIQDYSTVKMTGVPMYQEFAIRIDWIAYQYSRVVLPFADDGRTVDTLMSCVVHRAIPDLQV